uniref:Bryoporin-like n=1 Tax=Astyanax mexicanus TaxID=7994 RepID=A0A3B1JMA8_ASTMX
MAVASAVIAGASLFGTSAEQISRNINTGRNVTIQITNYSNKYTLVDPRIYTYSGHCHNPPQPTIKKNTQEVCSFSKTAHTACGAVGVLTYQIIPDERCRCIRELAIMFSVPYDYNHYKNLFALGIFLPNQPCDETLYNKMYYEEGQEYQRQNGTGSTMTYTSKDIILKGTMSPQGQSVMKVELWDKC